MRLGKLRVPAIWNYLLSLWNEIKRRNVARVAVAYAIVGWLEIASVAGPALRLPEWTTSLVVLLILLGLPLAIIFAWAFELTPEGLKREKDVDRNQSITSSTGRKLDNAIIGLLILAVAYFAIDKFVLDPGRDAIEIEAAVQSAQVEPTPDRELAKSIAVLPFVNMSDDPNNEYFSDGLSEELLNLLAKIPDLRVVARTSSFSFKEQPDVTVSEIAQLLNVAHILEGSVRKSGNHVRITAQLIDAELGYNIWSETYDRELENIFATQDEIAAAVTESLKVTLLGDTPRSRKTDTAAYQLFLEGQFLAHQGTNESLRQSIDLLEQAVEIAPDYAPAWAALAGSYWWLSAYGGMPTDQGFDFADAATERAMQSDPNYAWSYYVQGLMLTAYRFDFVAGPAALRTASDLDPGNADILFGHGVASMDLGRFDEAVTYLRRALQRDPLRPRFHEFLGRSYLGMGHLDDAEEQFSEQSELSPGYPGAWYRVGRMLVLRGHASEAIEVLKKETSLSYQLTGLAMAHYAAGNQAAAHSTLAALIDQFASGSAFQIAEVYAVRLDADNTFLWLDTAYDNRDSGLATLLATLEFHFLHSDPRWEKFLGDFGLLDAWLAMPPAYGGPSPAADD
jgi:TolB-like protein